MHSKGDTGLRAVKWVRGDQELITLLNRSRRDLELQALNAIKFSSHLPVTPARKLGTVRDQFPRAGRIQEVPGFALAGILTLAWP